MKNFVQEGMMVYVTATAAVKSGDGVQVGSGMFGVAGTDAAVGQTYALWLRGIYTLTKKNEVWAQGDPIYWDNVNKAATNVAGALLRIGLATKAVATATVLTGEVRLGVV
jgi:predicted RecA/RadA family phage recombinase